MTTLFITTSDMSSVINIISVRKITNLSNKDIKRIINSADGFPLMISSGCEDRDNRFIEDYQCPVIFNHDEFADPANVSKRILVVTKFEKTLYFV